MGFVLQSGGVIVVSSTRLVSSFFAYAPGCHSVYLWLFWEPREKGKGLTQESNRLHSAEPNTRLFHFLHKIFFSLPQVSQQLKRGFSNFTAFGVFKVWLLCPLIFMLVSFSKFNKMRVLLKFQTKCAFCDVKEFHCLVY